MYAGRNVLYHQLHDATIRQYCTSSCIAPTIANKQWFYDGLSDAFCRWVYITRLNGQRYPIPENDGYQRTSNYYDQWYTTYPNRMVLAILVPKEHYGIWMIAASMVMARWPSDPLNSIGVSTECGWYHLPQGISLYSKTWDIATRMSRNALWV